MRFPTKSLPTAMFILALASIGSEARAGFGSETFMVSTTMNAKTDLYQALSVPPFDHPLDTLSVVTLSFSDEAKMSGGLLNRSATSKNFTITDTVNFNATFGTYSLNDMLPASNTYSGLASGSTAVFGTYSLKGTSGVTTLINPTDLANFEGTSPLLFNFSALASVVVVGGGTRIPRSPPRPMPP